MKTKWEVTNERTAYLNNDFRTDIEDLTYGVQGQARQGKRLETEPSRLYTTKLYINKTVIHASSILSHMLYWRPVAQVRCRYVTPRNIC